MPLPYPWDMLDDFKSFDGLVWFRAEVDVPPSAAGRAATLGLGGVWDSDEPFVNATKVGEWPNGYGRPRVYDIPAGTLREGRNVIAVRVEDTSGRGGFWGEEEQLFLRAGSFEVSLADEWLYRVEQEYVSGKKAEISRRTPLALQFLHHHFDMIRPEARDIEREEQPAVEVALSVIPGALKFDRESFTVPAGERARLTFTNSGELPHNAVFVEPGTEDTVGALLDDMIGRGEAEVLGYVPDMDQVLFATATVNPNETDTLVFNARTRRVPTRFSARFPAIGG